MMQQIPYYYGDDLEYAHKRLSSTYVLTTNNSLFYVNAIRMTPKISLDGKSSFYAEGVEIDGKKKLNADESWFGLPIKELPVVKLNLAPLELGYIFCSRLGSASFLSRLPTRNLYKQGLHQNSLQWSTPKSTLSPDELLSPIFNKYLTLKEAFDFAVKEGTTYPFSRAFAVRKNGQLEYMGRHVVGQVMPHNNKAVAVLAPKFIYLQQHLDWSTK